MLQAILARDTGWVTIFGKSWDLDITESLKTTLAENLAMIRDPVEVNTDCRFTTPHSDNKKISSFAWFCYV
jgi:isopropylmalate/homocitrate/citramalate synthase